MSFVSVPQLDENVTITTQGDENVVVVTVNGVPGSELNADAIDGGSASTIYITSQIINGGNA